MKIPEVPIGEWVELYDAAIEFKELKPWRWMNSGDLFGVKNPENGEIAYCCIMGELGEVFSLTAYLGSEGINGYLALTTEIDEINPEVMHIQNCLMASFENRESLDKQDLKIIKEIGYKFRGKKQWPVFRTLEPGFFPWFLNSAQVRFLTVLLKQAIEVSLNAMSDVDYILEDETRCIARIPKIEDGKIIWKNEIINLEAEQKEIEAPVYTNEIKLRNLKKQYKQKQNITWGMDWFYSPEPVGEGERPYYPGVIFMVDGEMGEILGVELVQKIELLTKLQENFISKIESMGVIPKTLIIEKEEIYLSLRDIIDTLGIKVEMIQGVEMFNEVKNNMYNYFFNM